MEIVNQGMGITMLCVQEHQGRRITDVPLGMFDISLYLMSLVIGVGSVPHPCIGLAADAREILFCWKRRDEGDSLSGAIGGRSPIKSYRTSKPQGLRRMSLMALVSESP